jgi:hypothetical protein
MSEFLKGVWIPESILKRDSSKFQVMTYESVGRSLIMIYARSQNGWSISSLHRHDIVKWWSVQQWYGQSVLFRCHDGGQQPSLTERLINEKKSETDKIFMSV